MNTASTHSVSRPSEAPNQLESYMQQYANSDGLYLIDNNGNNVYCTPEFNLNTVPYAVQMLLYTVPRSLPSGWTQHSNWKGYSTHSVDRTPHVHIFYSTHSVDRTPHVHILATSKFGNFIGFINDVYPPPPLRFRNYSELSNKTLIGSYVNSF